MDKQVFKCECGYTTHFEKALTAHCKFRHHHPAEAETILPDVAEEVTKAVKKIKAEDEQPKQKKTTTRKPRAKKTAAKE